MEVSCWLSWYFVHITHPFTLFFISECIPGQNKLFFASLGTGVAFIALWLTYPLSIWSFHLEHVVHVCAGDRFYNHLKVCQYCSANHFIYYMSEYLIFTTYCEDVVKMNVFRFRSVNLFKGYLDSASAIKLLLPTNFSSILYLWSSNNIFVNFLSNLGAVSQKYSAKVCDQFL